MSYYFQICATERYQELYITFLLEHYSELNLPYSFPVALSYMASPVLMREEAILCFDQNDEIAGALGFIYGTGEQQYQDVHVVQLQVVFLQEEHRGTRLFLEGLQYLAQYLAALERKITEIRFWAPSQSELRQLFGKLAERVASSKTEGGEIDAYRASLDQWLAYGRRFRHEIYFDTCRGNKS
ncbi:hypothetical protein K0T92_14030 [Paenibacillus oenotherae]|uniref:N-acetyltransferase domain-containing protein n=1 Tax=Paenibacillus oenotherae TaxID=1435645 RepID=A0ABS7D7K9_9BACL|nr:hypothetical protein [Paenibacillus oenotherae]MBW7475861.1 hypothetical protein [Paenibacillus oenotherae]